MQAELIFIGQTPSQGEFATLHKRALISALLGRGITVSQTSASDVPTTDSLSSLVDDACHRSDPVICIGNDLPTDADALCKALSLPPLRQDSLSENTTLFFTTTEQPIGFAVSYEGARLIYLQENAYENTVLLQEQLFPYLDGLSRAVVVTHTVGVFGLPETAVAERLADLLMQQTPTVSTYSLAGELAVCATASADTVADAELLLKPLVESILDRLGSFVYGVDAGSLSQRVVHLLKEKHMKIATAESCTAGQLSGKLTQVSGASAVFECGIAAYSKEIKHSVLGVPTETLNKHGAVSPEAACAMASGARRIGGASFGVAITGVAGPEPSEGKPTGMVYIALADEKRVWVKQIMERHSDREQVRLMATLHALDLSRRYLEALPALMAGSLPLETAPERYEIISAPVVKQTLADRILISRAKGKTAKRLRIGLWILSLLLVAALIVSVAVFVLRPYRNRKMYQTLEGLYTESASPTISNMVSDLYPKQMLSQFYSLYDRNDDVRGWVKIDDTGISYPVMGGAYPDYYATHDFDGDESDYGVPYFDSNADLSSAESENKVLVVYGNNAGAGQMFSDLTEYRHMSFLQQHPYITMNTVYENAVYEIFAVMYIDSSYDNYEFDYTQNEFENDFAFDQFIRAIRHRSLFDVDTEVTYRDSLLLLSTDAYKELGFYKGRIVVAAKKLSSTEDLSSDGAWVSENTDVLLPSVLRPHPTSTTTASTTASKTRGTTTSTTKAAASTTASSTAGSTVSTTATTSSSTAPSSATTTTKPSTAVSDTNDGGTTVPAPSESRPLPSTPKPEDTAPSDPRDIDNE